MDLFGRIDYVFIYIWIILCIDISNLLTEGNILTVCAGNETSFYSDLSNTSTVFIIVFKKGTDTVGAYQPGKGISIDAEYKDRYSIVKERYGITLKINDTQVLDQGRFVCEITYRTGPDVITEKQLIVKERENSSLIMFDKMRQGFNTLITCSAIRGRVELKMPDKTTKTCSCCFIEQCSKDVCKTLTLNESDVNDGTMVKLLVVGIVFSALCNSIVIAIILRKKLLRTKKTKNGDGICFCIRNKQKSQPVYEYTTGTALNVERIKEDVTCEEDVRKNRKSQLKTVYGFTAVTALNAEPVYEYTTVTALNAEIFSSCCTSNEEDMDEKSVALTSVDSSKVDVQVESDNYSSFVGGTILLNCLTPTGETSPLNCPTPTGETLPLNCPTPTGETLPLTEIIEIRSR